MIKHVFESMLGVIAALMVLNCFNWIMDRSRSLSKTQKNQERKSKGITIRFKSNYFTNKALKSRYNKYHKEKDENLEEELEDETPSNLEKENRRINQRQTRQSRPARPQRTRRAYNPNYDDQRQQDMGYVTGYYRQPSVKTSFSISHLAQEKKIGLGFRSNAGGLLSKDHSTYGSMRNTKKNSQGFGSGLSSMIGIHGSKSNHGSIFGQTKKGTGLHSMFGF